jgi:hypothetical protein
MRDSKWSHDELKAQYRMEAGKVMSEADGMFTIDGCDIPKKGNDSVGASRQYCGRLGKTDNCQASVMVGYSSALNGYCLLDGRLLDFRISVKSPKRTMPCTMYSPPIKSGWRRRGEARF